MYTEKERENGARETGTPRQYNSHFSKNTTLPNAFLMNSSGLSEKKKKKKGKKNLYEILAPFLISLKNLSEKPFFILKTFSNLS